MGVRIGARATTTPTLTSGGHLWAKVKAHSDQCGHLGVKVTLVPTGRLLAEHICREKAPTMINSVLTIDNVSPSEVYAVYTCKKGHVFSNGAKKGKVRCVCYGDVSVEDCIREYWC